MNVSRAEILRSLKVHNNVCSFVLKVTCETTSVRKKVCFCFSMGIPLLHLFDLLFLFCACFKDRRDINIFVLETTLLVLVTLWRSSEELSRFSVSKIVFKKVF